MTPDETEALLARLGRGEADAAGELYEAYGAYLRAVVRRRLAPHLRAQFDSADVVQSVWVQVVRRLASDGWRVETEAELRSLLGVVARRRLFTRARTLAADAARNRGPGEGLDAVPAHGQARASEVAQAGELWDTLLSLCPPEQQEVLRLRRDGLGATEIADRTGLHEGSVRRILRRLARELALRENPLPATPGDES